MRRRVQLLLVSPILYAGFQDTSHDCLWDKTGKVRRPEHRITQAVRCSSYMILIKTHPWFQLSLKQTIVHLPVIPRKYIRRKRIELPLSFRPQMQTDIFLQRRIPQIAQLIRWNHFPGIYASIRLSHRNFLDKPTRLLNHRCLRQEYGDLPRSWKKR